MLWEVGVNVNDAQREREENRIEGPSFAIRRIHKRQRNKIYGFQINVFHMFKHHNKRWLNEYRRKLWN